MGGQPLAIPYRPIPDRTSEIPLIDSLDENTGEPSPAYRELMVDVWYPG